MRAFAAVGMAMAGPLVLLAAPAERRFQRGLERLLLRGAPLLFEGEPEDDREGLLAREGGLVQVLLGVDQRREREPEHRHGGEQRGSALVCSTRHAGTLANRGDRVN